MIFKILHYVVHFKIKQIPTNHIMFLVRDCIHTFLDFKYAFKLSNFSLHIKILQFNLLANLIGLFFY